MHTEIQEIKLPTNQLEIGMHVTQLDRPWLESKFLMQGFVIRDEEELKQLMREHKYVVVEYTRDFDSRFGPRKVMSVQESQNAGTKITHVGRLKYATRIAFEKEFDNAKQQFQSARQFSRKFMQGIRHGETLDMEQARTVVENCVESLMNNNEALVWLTKIKNKDEYTAEHSMNVCVIAANFARHLGLPEAEIIEVGLCGLLHDVGKTNIPLEILNKPDKLTREEFELIKNHPEFGRELLASTSNTQSHVIDAAFSHHEREDGSGYPRGLVGEEIALYSKIVAIADTYDAITSNRCYDSSRSSAIALKVLHQSREKLYDSKLVDDFIRCIGVYPPGSVVEMRTGEVGIITKSHPNNRLKPQVMLVTDANQNKLPIPKVIETAKTSTDAVPYTIAREVTNGAFGVELRDYLALGFQVGFD
jgi:putative nucleotidyltransferase with HDIG domain